MASVGPGLAAGTADASGNILAADAAATAVSNLKNMTNLQKSGRQQAETITGG